MPEAEVVPADFPFESRFVDVYGSKMHYIDEGEGDVVLFLHGNPTSSYLWRNIIPHLSGQARCIAVDLIGMGKSDHPDIAYRYDDQYRYLCGFVDELDIGSNLTLVIHDWGSGLGFRWAHEHKDEVRGIAFMEGMIRGLSLDDIPGNLRIAMKIMRAPFTGWLMISVGNIFLKKLLPDLAHATISDDALAYYRSAFPTIASRKAVRVWPQEVPFDGKPVDNTLVVNAYNEWLTQTEIPKLLLYGDDGISIKEADVEWCRDNMSNLSIVHLGTGIHFLQETHPAAIGAAVSGWYAAF